MHQPHTSANQPNIRVLVVDDIVETRENLRKILYYEDAIEVLGAAANGEQGIQMTVELQPDIVLIDVNMPAMDGITAAQRIIEQVPVTRVILMFTKDEDNYRQRSDLAGAKAYLIKPFPADELVATIHRVCQPRS